MAYIPPLNGGRLNASIGGNSTSAGAGYSLLSTGTMFLAGGNNVTLSQNGGSITISAGAAGASLNFSASNTSANLASVTFSNSNGVSFGLNAGVITASHNALTSQSDQALSGSNGSIAFQTATFGNLNGLSFYTSNGSMVGSYTAPTQTLQTQGWETVSLGGNSTSAGAGYAPISSGTMLLAGGNNITLSQNGNSVTISGGAGGGGAALSAAGASASNGTVVFSNSNGVNFGMAGSTITASHNGITSQSIQSQNLVSINGSTGNISFDNAGNVGFGLNASTITASYSQTNQTLGLFAGGNTTGQSSNSTLDARSLTFNGLGGVSVGYSNGSVQISGNTGGGGGGGGIALYDGTNSVSSGTVSIVASGALGATITNQTLNLSAPSISSLSATGALGLSTSGNTISIGAPQTSSLSATGALSISRNVSTISIGAPLNGTISNWEPVPIQNVSMTSGQIGQGSVMFVKLTPQAYINASQLMQLVSISMASVNSSHKATISVGAGIYTNNGSTLNLITQSSGTASYSWTNSSTNNATSINGLRGLSLPLNVAMSPGNYWLGMWSSTASSVTNAAVPFNVFQQFGPSVTYSGLFGQVSNATQGIQEAVGILSATAALPSSVAMSKITQGTLASISSPYIVFKNMTF